MDKMVLDAMNKGWALGFGTRVQIVDVDFEAARARGVPLEREPALAGQLDLRVLTTILIWRRAQH